MKALKFMSHTSLSFNLPPHLISFIDSFHSHWRFSSKLKHNSVLTWPKPAEQRQKITHVCKKKSVQIFASAVTEGLLLLWWMEGRGGQEDTDYINKAEVGHAWTREEVRGSILSVLVKSTKAKLKTLDKWADVWMGNEPGSKKLEPSSKVLRSSRFDMRWW